MVWEPDALLGVKAAGVSEKCGFGKDVDALCLSFGSGVELGETQGEGFLGCALDVQIEMKDSVLGMKEPHWGRGEELDLGLRGGLCVRWDGREGERKQKGQPKRKCKRK